MLLNLWGGNLSLRRSDCLDVGFADSAFRGGYHADRDFGLRCLKAGLSGVFDRSLRAKHLYRRGLNGFVTDARSSGATLLLVHERHSDVVGALDLESRFRRGLPRPAAWLVAACRQQVTRRLVVASLLGAIRCRWALRVTALSLPAARLLRRIEQQHGALAALRETGHSRRLKLPVR